MTKTEKAVTWAIEIANDPAHGYDQDNRWGPDYDCSSLVISAWQQAGVPVKTKGATYTGNMKSVFLSCGKENKNGVKYGFRAESTAEKLSKETPDCKVSVFDLADEAKLKEEVANADILVNATLAGMKPHDDITLVDKSMFHKDLVVADCVYNPAETKMVKEAKEAGCKLAIGGKGMLLWQGAAAYKLYTGLEMPTAEYQKFQEENENK